MAHLSWITDDDLISHVKHLLDKAYEANTKTKESFNKNVIDPFSAFFQMSGFNLDHDTWYQNETLRQAQKTLQNHIGEFHQNVLGSVQGWTNLGVGNVVDLVNHEKKVIAEVKNKYNTLSGGQLAPMYRSLEAQVAPKSSIYFGYEAYYVTVIPSKPARLNKAFTPSNREKGAKENINERIRQIDGASFYSMVTGSETALADMFSVLPIVVSELLGLSLQKGDWQILNKYFKDAFGA